MTTATDQHPEPPGRACPVCGQQTSRPYLRKSGQELVQCLDCQTVYTPRLPPAVAEGTYYTSHGVYYLMSDKLQSDFSPVRHEREIRLFHRFCPQGMLLDVGCSTGGFLHQLQRRFPGRYQLFGIDLSEPAVTHAQSLNLKVQQGDLLNAPLQAGSFDAVTFWAVMEHLVDPAAYLHRAARLLRPGGWCFILVPNLSSLAVRLLGVRYRYFMQEHINWFNAHTLRRFIAMEPTLRIRRVTATHFNPMVLLQDAWHPRDHVPGEERAALLKRTTQWKQQPLLYPLRMIYRLAELGLAQFNLADNLALVAQRAG